MAVGVAIAAGDDAQLRLNRREDHVTAGRGRAVVMHLVDLGRTDRQRDSRLGIDAAEGEVAAESLVELAILDLEHEAERVLVGRAHPGAREIHARDRDRMRRQGIQRDDLALDERAAAIAQDLGVLGVALGRVRAAAIPSVADRDAGSGDLGHVVDVVLVIVAREHVIDVRDADRLELLDHALAHGRGQRAVPVVDHHDLAERRHDERAVTLADVEVVDLKAAVRRHGSRGRRGERRESQAGKRRGERRAQRADRGHRVSAVPALPRGRTQDRRDVDELLANDVKAVNTSRVAVKATNAAPSGSTRKPREGRASCTIRTIR